MLNRLIKGVKMSDKIYRECCGYKIAVTRQQVLGNKPFRECPNCHRRKDWKFFIEGARKKFERRDMIRYLNAL